MSELGLRWISAGMLLPPLLYVCYLGGYWFVAIIAVLSAVAVNEFYGFIVAKGARAHRAFGTVATAALPFVVYLGDATLATSFLTAVLLVTLLLQLGKRRIEEAIASISATFFGVYYCGWLLSHAVSLRQLPVDPRLASLELPAEAGICYVILAVAGALGSDAGAFFVGRRFGRHKLAPKVSPGKTLEGAAGGLVAGALLVLLCKLAFDHLLPGGLASGLGSGAALLMGAAIAVAAIVGDLIESLLKRDAHVKDAGHVLPGVGGVLDRIDSALFAFPVMYYLLLGYYHFGRVA